MSASLLLQIAVKVSILLAMAWLVTRAMRRSSASARHFVWAIAIVAVLFVPVMVLVGPAWQVKILPAPLTAAPQPAAERFDAAQSDSGVGDRFESGNPTPSIPPTHSTGSGSTVSSAERSTGSGSAVNEVSLSNLTRVDAATSASQDPIYWQPWLLGLWAAGVAFVLLRLGIGIVWVCWTARRAEPITDALWLSILEEVTTTLQLTGRVLSLRRSGRTTVPVACGIWRPTLLMPLDADEWSADRRRVVLLHELAHVKRRDCRLQAIAQVAYAWHWFNPLVHVAVARLRAEQERACDDLVLAAGTDGPAYADHLFEIARAFRSDALPRWAMLAMAAPSQLEGRVLAILDGHQRRHVLSRVHRFAVASVVAVTALTLSAFRLSASSDETLPNQLEAIDSNNGADDTQSTDIDVDFDSLSLATPDIALVPPVDHAPPDLPQLAAQGPDSRFNPWLDGLKHNLPFDFEPPIDLQINVDPIPDPNPDFDFNFDFNLDPPVIGWFGSQGSQTPAADGVPDETRRRVADALSLAINDENPRVRAQAIQGLASMRDPRAVPALIKALQSPDVRLRRIAVNSLSQFDTPEAAQGLVGALKDENPDVRRVAISALSRRRDEKYADAIIGALKDQNPDVRRQAVAALGRAGQSAAVVGALVQALKDSDADVRERAAGSLARVRSTEAVPALIAALKDANAEVRKMSAIALGSIADPRAIDALTAALKDMDAEVREHAARALGRIARGQQRGPGRFPVANLDFKELEREVEKVQKVEIEKMHKVYQDLVDEKHLSWSLGSLDPHEMVDAAMRQADKAFKQYEENWRQLEQKGWTGKN